MGESETGLPSIVPPVLLEGGHSSDIEGEGAREYEKGEVGVFCMEKRRSLGAGRCGVRET